MVRMSNGLDPDRDRLLLVLISVLTICKGLQNMTKVAARTENTPKWDEYCVYQQ